MNTTPGDENPLDERLLEIIGSGLVAWKGLPRFGRQDLGYSPGGAQDRFALYSGNILLRNDPVIPALEMLKPPRAVRFTRDCCFVITGGHLEAELSPGAGSGTRPVEHAGVCFAPAGSELRFRRRLYGLRTYLCCRPASPAALTQVGITRGPFPEVARWPDPGGRIRVLVGPEYAVLEDPAALFRTRWLVTRELNDMGIRLAGDSAAIRLARREQLVSAPVCDGTIQMTPSGPIVLMRERQTTGGYPRVGVVITPDIDLLAQTGPGAHLRFLPVSRTRAGEIGAIQQHDLDTLSRRAVHRHGDSGS